MEPDLIIFGLPGPRLACDNSVFSFLVKSDIFLFSGIFSSTSKLLFPSHRLLMRFNSMFISNGVSISFFVILSGMKSENSLIDISDFPKNFISRKISIFFLYGIQIR